MGMRKEIEEGKFRWPEVSGDQNKVQLSHEELALLLGGIDLGRRNGGGGTGGELRKSLRHELVTGILW